MAATPTPRPTRVDPAAAAAGGQRANPALAPLLGAGLVVWLGYEASFYATIATMLAALIVLVWKVEEPRRKRLASLEPKGK